MPDISLAHYETWDLRQPACDRPTRLYSLEPIGIGTRLTESLVSYLMRLAAAHCVSVGNLFHKEIEPVIGKKSQIGYVARSAMNGVGIVAADMVHALEHLTGQTELRYLTFIPWAEVFPRNFLLRRKKAWCPQCFTGWQETGVFHEPLLWSVDVVMVCPTHACALEVVCPHCRKEQPAIGHAARPAFCARCYQWLGCMSETPAGEDQERLTKELSGQLWIATAVDELITASPKVNLPRTIIADFVMSCLNQLVGGDVVRFAHMLQIYPATVDAWIQGRSRPHLSTLLSIGSLAGVTLLDFLNGKTVINTDQLLKPDPVPRRQTKRQNFARVNVDQLRRMLQSALRTSPPTSLNAVIKQTGYSTKSVYQHCPHLCQAIATRFQEYKKSQAILRQEQGLREIQVVATELHKQGIYPATHKVRDLMMYPSCLNTQEGVAKLNQMQQELGWTKTEKSFKSDGLLVKERTTERNPIPVLTKYTLAGAGTIGQVAVASVLRLVCPKTGSKGTGFVHKNGWVLTDHQVIEGYAANEIIGYTASGYRVMFDQVIGETAIGLAALKPKQPLSGGLKLDLTQPPDVGSALITWGFPLGYNGPFPLLSVGYLAGFHESTLDQSPRLVVNGAFNPGNSGGPLFRVNDDQVIGIVVGKPPSMAQFHHDAIRTLASSLLGVASAPTLPDELSKRFVESQIVSELLAYFHDLTQLMIGEAISSRLVRDFLESIGLENND
ncbi:MAG: TniQ family protein [Blastocatellia bacterium]|nr:TniQ family protein [Blastocatellia bacterium]